jgi:hypothetical protein
VSVQLPFVEVLATVAGVAAATLATVVAGVVATAGAAATTVGLAVGAAVLADELPAVPATITPVIAATAANPATPATRRALRAGCGSLLRFCKAASRAAAAAPTSVSLPEFGVLFGPLFMIVVLSCGSSYEVMCS